jgi:endonuclease/exonuclease/phosphatase family metal-dependent hydrolase
MHDRISPLAAALLALLALPLLLLGCDSGDPDETAAEVSVMSYNLYLGADIFDLVGAPPEQVPAVAAALWAEVQATDFPTRARAIAAITKTHNPHLIGLQEVTLYRSQTPSDYIQGVTEPNAEDVEYDFLQIMMDALAAEGLEYTVVSTVENADVELPATYDGQNFFDIRLTDRDVILARSGVSVSNPVEANFSASVTAEIPVGGQSIPFTRGYQHVRATVDGATFTFANSHLEVQVAAPQQPQEGQALELLNALANVTQPVILVGDFNSPADGSGTATYEILTSQYSDAVSIAGPVLPTCCQAADLRNPTSELTTRIDLILFRGDVTAVSTATVGNQPADRIEGLWPSDHAGVVARLRLND